MTTPTIPKNELKDRIESLQSTMTTNDMDAMIIPLGVHFGYFFGKIGTPSERLVVGIIPRDSSPFLITPSFEMDNYRINTYIDDISGWNETDSPYQLLQQELKSRNIGNSIGVDPQLWYIEVEKMIQATNRSFVSGHSILHQIRSVKSDWEIQQLKKAAEYSARGIIAALSTIKEGVTEIAFQEVVHTEMRNLSGSSYAGVMVQFGENSAVPHGKPTNRKLKKDEVVLVDGGTSFNGYQGDITITVPFGNPKGYKEIYEIVYEANRKALYLDKEGTIPSNLDKAARDHIANKGFGDNFTHRLGHGLGLEIHEEPYVVANNSIPLTSGNAHTIEPGIYQLGKFGVRIEDDVLVQKDKATLLYETPRHNFDLI